MSPEHRGDPSGAGRVQRRRCGGPDGRRPWGERDRPPMLSRPARRSDGARQIAEDDDAVSGGPTRPATAHWTSTGPAVATTGREQRRRGPHRRQRRHERRDSTGDNGGPNGRDGDRTGGNDGTATVTDTRQRRHSGGNNGGDNSRDRDRTGGNDGTNGGANTGDGDRTAGNDGTRGGDNTYVPAPAAGGGGDSSGGGGGDT